MKILIGLMTIDLFIPSCRSLKAKRLVVKSLKDKIRGKYNVSISEVDFLDKWQRARLGIVQVGNDYHFIEKNMNAIFNLIEINGNVEIFEHDFEFI